jgi:hypothetical protein
MEGGAKMKETTRIRYGDDICVTRMHNRRLSVKKLKETFVIRFEKCEQPLDLRPRALVEIERNKVTTTISISHEAAIELMAAIDELLKEAQK